MGRRHGRRYLAQPQSVVDYIKAFISGNIFLRIVSPNILVEQAYVVYDFGGALGAVGGSLGLFVGFALYQCVAASADALVAFAKGNNETKSNPHT